MSWRISAFIAFGVSAGIAYARVTQDPETGTATWDAARAAGFAAYLMLWGATVLGIAVHFRLRPWRAPLTLILETHRICSTLALSFVAGHVAALLMDPVVHFAPVDALVPFVAGYRPVQVGIGTIGLWLLLITLGSTALAGRMAYGKWRALHYLALPCFLAALIHGITAGTDSASVGGLTVYATTAATTAAALFARVLGRGWVAAGEAPGAVR